MIKTSAKSLLHFSLTKVILNFFTTVCKSASAISIQESALNTPYVYSSEKNVIARVSRILWHQLYWIFRSMPLCHIVGL